MWFYPRNCRSDGKITSRGDRVIKTKVSKPKAIRIIRSIKKNEAFVTDGEPDYIGREALIEKIDKDLEEIEKGESIFRLVKGEHGSGKSHLLSVIREKAFNKDFIVSTFNLSPKEGTLNKIEKIYKKFIKNIRANKCRKAPALSFIIRKWSKEADSKNYSYCRHGMKPFTCGYPVCRVPKEFYLLKNDIQSALRVCRDEWKYGNGKITQNLDLVIKWFSGAKVLLREIRTLGIENRIDRDNSIEYMGEVCKLINHLGYKGIILLLDEEEANSSVALDKTLESFKNLCLLRSRLLRFPHIYIVYTACPDFYSVLRTENMTQENYNNISEVLDIPIEFMDLETSVKEIDDMTLKMDNLTLEEVEEMAHQFIDIYQTAYEWTAPDDVYSNIFRTFIPEIIEKNFTAKVIYDNLISILDNTRQEGEESVQDLDASELKWVDEDYI